MDSVQLTKKQRQFLDFILAYREHYNVWPTYREIAEEFGFKSPNSVTQNIQALTRKEVLVRTRDDEYDLNPEWARKHGLQSGLDDAEGIPVRGLIAAGLMQEAVEADLGQVTMEHLFPNKDKVFALRVSGMSMKDEGIFDGDFVLITEGSLGNGEIGAVMYDGETTLKRVYKEPSGLRLVAANDEFDDIELTPREAEEVTIIGGYVGHVNRSGFFRAPDRRTIH
ncbi:MAG: transcriptional repressor LexA [Balneolaceae bacterium]|nr:transcriptional repressor LexA [Balneolaceae bacterium]